MILSLEELKVLNGIQNAHFLKNEIDVNYMSCEWKSNAKKFFLAWHYYEYNDATCIESLKTTTKMEFELSEPTKYKAGKVFLSTEFLEGIETTRPWLTIFKEVCKKLV